MLNLQTLVNMNEAVIGAHLDDRRVIQVDPGSFHRVESYEQAQNELRHLNLAFIQVALEQAWFSELLAKRLMQCSEEHRRRMADVPFALFDLGLSDSAPWQSGARTSGAQFGSVLLDSATLFAINALSYACHLARCEASGAKRLLLGLSSSVAAQLKCVEPTATAQIALVVRPYLRPRWADNMRFWNALLNSEATEGEWLRVQLWGRQLLATTGLKAIQSKNSFRRRMELKGRAQRCS